MSAAQVSDDWWADMNRGRPICPCGCGDRYGQCCANSFRLPPPPAFYLSAESEPPFPTTPPGVLLMPEDQPIDRNAPTEAPETETDRDTQPPESTTDPSRVLAEATRGDSYFASAAREFRDCLVELRGTRREIGDGFRTQGAELAQILRGVSSLNQRTTALETAAGETRIELSEMKRDFRSELAQVRSDLRGALDRLELLEADYPKAKTSAPAPPAPSTGA